MKNPSDDEWACDTVIENLYTKYMEEWSTKLTEMGAEMAKMEAAKDACAEEEEQMDCMAKWMCEEDDEECWAKFEDHMGDYQEWDEYDTMYHGDADNMGDDYEWDGVYEGGDFSGDMDEGTDEWDDDTHEFGGEPMDDEDWDSDMP
jgi:hypothetical protein